MSERTVRTRALAVLGGIVLTAAACGSDGGGGTPTPTATSTNTVAPRATATVTATATVRPTVTPTATATPSPTPTSAPARTATPTVTPRVCVFDRFHGCQAIHVDATGRFRTAQIDGVWWLITPEGNAYFSAGVNHTTPDGDYSPALGTAPYHDNIIARYGSVAAWADVVVQRFTDLGMTTIGAWSNYDLFTGRIPYTTILGFAGHAPEVPGVLQSLTGQRLRDYFAPQFTTGATAEAEGARGCAADAFCVGVFSDNELGWGPGIAQTLPYLDAYLRLPAGAPGKVALQAFFEQLYAGDVAAFNAVWNQHLTTFDDLQALPSLPRSVTADPPDRAAVRQAFAGTVAGRYYQTVHDALRAIRPDLLILGSRLLAYYTAPAVIAASGPFVDVVSANQYEVAPATLDLLRAAAAPNGYIVTGDLFADLDEFYRLAQKPMLISEFSYRAADSGLPNTYPPTFPTLATQADRADAYERYMRQVLERPYMVGAHWFEYADEPAQGRFDGENDNWGIVNIADDEYPELAARMRLVNGGIYQRGGADSPTLTPTPTCTPTATTVERVCAFDQFSGCTAIHVEGTGHFRTALIDGAWWLITPEGHAYFSAGVNGTRPEGDYAPALGRAPYYDNVLAQYGTEAAWADVVVGRFADLGFTSLGAWSKYALFAGRIPYPVILGFAARAPAVSGVGPSVTGLRVRDYFAPEFVAGAAVEADGARACAADTFCIGVFSDNELGWGPGVAQTLSFLDAYMHLPAGAPGKVALQAFFERLYGGDVTAFNAVWNQQLARFDDLQTLSSLPRSVTADPPARAAARQAFAGPVAQRYCQVVYDALRAVSPDLLILGSRLLAYSTSAPVIAACAPFVDVVSANQYEVTPGALQLLLAAAHRNGYIVTGDLFGDLDELHWLAQKPMLISEFGYRAADSGLPNTFPPQFPTLATQAERAAAYEQYMRRVLERPYMVGAHWFKYADEPAQGRADGENDNWGIVNVEDVEYPDLAARMRVVNGNVYQR
jgi:hypothetical protein